MTSFIARTSSRRAPTTSEKSRNSRIRASVMRTISLGTSAVRCMALAPTSSTAMPNATNGTAKRCPAR